MPSAILPQNPPNKPDPRPKEPNHKRHVRRDDRPPPLPREIPQIPPQVQQRGRRVHEQERHNHVDACFLPVRDVVVQHEQGGADGDVVRQEGSVEVVGPAVEVGLEEERGGVLEEEAGFNGCDGVGEFGFRADEGVVGVVWVAGGAGGGGESCVGGGRGRGAPFRGVEGVEREEGDEGGVEGGDCFYGFREAGGGGGGAR